MHIGKHNSECPRLKVHNEEMENIDELTYLGEKITSNGKNEKNIANRVSKGFGLVNDIMDILDNMSLGTYYFHVAHLLRSSLLINGMLYNVDVTYNLSDSDVKELSKVDKSLLCKVMKVPNSTPTEALYLELGIEDFNAIISKRRLTYFHDVIKRPKKDMLY